MKAFVYEKYGAPDVLNMREVEKPMPRSGEVLVKVEAMAVNPTDWRNMRGDPFLVRLEVGLFKPKSGILGADIAGRVQMVGANVTRFKPGDRVCGDVAQGGFAEYVRTPAENLIHNPDNLSYAEAAALPKAAITALQGLRDAGQLQAGQTVLVNGASGGVGTFAVQIARSLGVTVTGVCSTRNLEMVRALGAAEVIDYTKEDFTQRGETYDLVLDLVGNRLVAEVQRALNPQGICVVIGFTSMGHMARTMLLGTWVSRRSSQTIAPMNARINQKELTAVKKLVESGAVKPVIDRSYPFHEIPKAVAYLEQGHARGKVIIHTDE